MSRRRLTIDEMEARCPDMAKGQRLRFARSKYWFHCLLGHPDYKQSFAHHDQGESCPRCKAAACGALQRLTMEQMYARQLDLIEGQMCRGARAKYWYRCSAGHPNYEQSYDSHNRGRGCPECGGSKPLTIEKAEALFPDLVKGQRWRGNRAKYEFLCVIHGVYSQSYTDHHAGKRCAECGREKTRISRMLTVEQAEERHVDLVKGQMWRGVVAEYQYVCGVHGTYKQSFAHHDQGRGCRKCGQERSNNAKRWSIEEVEAEQSDLVKEQTWKGTGAKYKYICAVHGIYEQSFAHHARGQKCPRCAGGHWCIEQVEGSQPDLIKGQTWRGTHAEYQYACSTHGVYSQLFGLHKRGSSCQKCARATLSKHFSLTIEEAEKRFPDIVEGQAWHGAGEKYQFRCIRHGVYSQTYNSHDSGARCPKCKQSNNEKRIASFLKNEGLLCETQKSFATCRVTYPLRFDFYIPSHNVLGEYQGEQHYTAVDFGGKGKAHANKRFRDLQRRDRIKKNWARRNGFKLILIPYRVKNIEAFLQKRLDPLMGFGNKGKGIVPMLEQLNIPVSTTYLSIELAKAA